MGLSGCTTLKIDRDFPEPRLIAHGVAVLRSGGVIAYPTDTNYGFGCSITDKASIDRIYRLKKLDKSHQLSLVCADLSDIARYAMVENEAYRIMRRHLPGPYTFILRATPLVPQIFQSERKTVGIRVPNHPVTLALARTYQGPIVSSTTKVGDKILSGSEEIKDVFGYGLDLIMDAGPLTGDDSTVIDLSGPYPEVVRKGAGDVSWLMV